MLPTKIAFLFEFSTVSGGEGSFLNLLENLDRERYQVAVLLPEEGELSTRLRGLDLEFVAYDLRHQGRRRAFDEVADELAPLLRSLGAKLLHSNSLSGGEYSGLIGARAGIPAVSHVRDIQKLKNSRRRRLSQNQGLICVSQAVKDSLVEQSIDADKCHVVWNGISPDFGRGVELERELWPGATGHERVIANVGQICLRKAQDLLLDVCLPVLRERADCHLVIVGERFSEKQESRDYERQLHERVKAANMEGQVHFLGYRRDVAAILKHSQLLLHPAHQEPLGRVLLESQILGLPVLAFDIGGNSEVVGHEQTGLLLSKGDIKAMQQCLVELLSNDKKHRRFSENARERARLRFEPQRSARKVQEIYESLLV